MIAAMGAIRVVYSIDQEMGWKSSFQPAAAADTLVTLAASMFTLIVFVSSALLLAVQLASAQLSPRIIALVFKDPVTKLSMTVFVFAFSFSITTVLRIDTSVPMLALQISGFGFIASIGLFLYLIDHVGRFVRPSGALRTVRLLGHRVVDSVYPRRLDESRDTPASTGGTLDGQPRAITSNRGGVILALDVRGLVTLAERFDCVIEMVPLVGDFVAAGDPLFRVFHGGANLPVRSLRHSVAVGQERTIEQDPTFAFRIMVDIASKGLSPAINDPTTAVLAIDQIHHLLREVGSRHLDEGQVRDAAGRLRFAYRTPDWEDFVQLAVTEIRHFGGTSIQIAKRLRAMLDNLIATLPEGRAAPLRNELKLLNQSIDRFFAEPEDRLLANISDPQGVGGKRE
jgi:uncharacterized membrane protein